MAQRVLAILWLFVGITLISNLTAAITAQNTVETLRNEIRGPADLSGKRVATVEGTTASRFLNRNNIPCVPVARIEDAYALLLNRSVDAVVYNSPVLQYYASHQGRGFVEMAEFYGSPYHPAACCASRSIAQFWN